MQSRVDSKLNKNSNYILLPTLQTYCHVMKYRHNV